MQMWTYPYLYLPSLPKSGKKSETPGPGGQSPSASSAQSQKLGPTFLACQGPGGPVRRNPAVLNGLSRVLTFHFKTSFPVLIHFLQIPPPPLWFVRVKMVLDYVIHIWKMPK